MSEILQTVISYAEMAAAMLVWVLICCGLVAGLEFVVYKIFPRSAGPHVVIVPRGADGPPQTGTR